MAGIFISYRRDDAQGWAGRLTADLKRSLRGVRIFRDVDTIPAGTQYAEYTVAAVGSCSVLIALIGPRWLNAMDESGKRRLDDPHDLTRLEIVAALNHNVTVIPTLVAGARLPRPEELPDDLKPLVARQGYLLEDSSWQDDVTRLVAVVKPLVRAQRHRIGVLVAAAALLVLLVLGWYGARSLRDRVETETPTASQSATGLDAPRDVVRPLQTSAAPPPQRAAAPERPTSSAPPPRRAESREASPGDAPAPPPATERMNAEKALLEAQVKARASYTAAVNAQERAEESARSAQRLSGDATKAANAAKAAFPTQASYEAAQTAVDSALSNASKAREAAFRADAAARKSREAVATAQKHASETGRTNDPISAARAAEAAVAAEETATAAAADAHNEADTAVQFAKASATATNQAMSLAPGTTIFEASCAAVGPSRYRVDLAGEAKGPPTSSLSVHVGPAPTEQVTYSVGSNVICTVWRPARFPDGRVDNSTCANGDIATPLTRWTASIAYQSREYDAPPRRASASIVDSKGTGRELSAVSLTCQ